jgi:hypothetical protein
MDSRCGIFKICVVERRGRGGGRQGTRRQQEQAERRFSGGRGFGRVERVVIWRTEEGDARWEGVKEWIAQGRAAQLKEADCRGVRQARARARSAMLATMCTATAFP